MAATTDASPSAIARVRARLIDPVVDVGRTILMRDDPTPADAPLRRLAPSIGFVLAAMLGFVLLRGGTVVVAVDEPQLILAWCAVIALVSLPFAWIGYGETPDFMRRFLKGSTIFLALYFAIEPFDIPPAALSEDHIAVRFHDAGRWIGLILAFVGWRSPPAVFVSAMILWMMRELQTEITGFYFSTLDIRNVAEVIALAAMGMSFIAAALRIKSVREALDFDETAARQAALMILAAGIGGHLGNYFFSALAKLSLDGGVFSWIFGNQLYEGMLGAVEKGTMPFAASPELAGGVIAATKAANFPLHLFSFFAQFAAIIAPWRRRWLITLTLTYDLFHLMVYVTFGLLFWKWIALNTMIVATLAVISDADWRRFGRVPCIVLVITGAIFFRTATLAWYDSPGFTSLYFEAETVDGERYRIPNAYWGSASYQVSQGRFYVPENTEHFNHSIWGSVLHHDDLEAGRACKAPEREAPTPALYGPLEKVETYVAARHAQVLDKINDDGRFNYYLLPHHHLPAPFLEDPFYGVDKRRIASYIYVVDSVCLSLEDGKVARKVIARTEIPVYSPPSAARVDGKAEAAPK